ncbi:transferrin-binding protein-like solute binding protein [Haemophilus influenzae]|uniref:transferrin-binding protein-like solute binding protein n=1 Tax=Haemophilus influenzae TaxID=727 RepID=UPI000DD37082|nr:transferrin-binding protein-like solute binding protein [Haemophilus influenzae]
MKSVPLITGGLSFLLSACSGGGSFDVDNVSNPSSSKPRYQDDTSSSRTKSKLENLSIPSLGGGMKLVALNLRDKNKPSLLNEDDYISYFSSLSTIEKDVQENNKNGGGLIGSINEPPKAPNSTKNSHGQQYVYSGLYYIQSWRDSSNGKFYSGYYGYAYYFGKQTATTLPVDGKVTYKGTWSFITAAENGKNYELLRNYDSSAYSRRSATPEDIDLEVENEKGREKGLVSEFSADFGNKKLTGQLFYTKRENNNQAYKKEKLYDIDAHIYSNRFRGKVIPKESTSNDHPFTSEGTLEGGFYGPNAEELGGKFLAKDKRVFGVFSAKETTKDPKLSKETLIDGKLITFKRTDATTSTTTNTAASTTTNTAASTTTDAKTNAENFKTEDIPSFGEADYLLIDNQPIPLLPEKNTNDFISSRHHKVGNKTYKVEACCSNLNYVKFGMYYEVPLNTEKDKEKEKQTAATTNTYYQFLLGHRTVSSEIPATGNVKYHGSWFGYIGDGTTSYSATGDKNALAEFDVNFADKKLTGELKRHDNQNTVFKIDATFNGGNSFKGTATAKDLVIDGENSQTQNAKINITTDVNGAFYGPNATELGGYFTYNGKDTITKNSESSSTVSSSSNSEKARAAVVFGAKRQVETNKK